MPLYLPRQDYRLGEGGGRFRKRRLQPPPVEAEPRLAPSLPVPAQPQLRPEPESRDLLPEYLAATKQGQMPRREDYAPTSRLQRVLGAIATGWMGGAGGPKAAQETYEGIFDKPYNRAMERFGTEEGLRRQRVSELQPAMESRDRRELLRETIAGRKQIADQAAQDRADALAERKLGAEAAAQLKRDQLNEPKFVPPGTGVLRQGETTPSYTQPFAPKEEPRKLLTPEEEAQQTRLRAAGRQGEMAKPRLKNVELYDPATKKSWSLSVDADTGKEISRVEVSKPPKPEAPIPAMIKKDMAVLDATDKVLEEIGKKASANPDWIRGSLTGISALTRRIEEKKGTISKEEALFRKTVKGNLVEQIHQLSGAAVSPTEAERLIQALPDFDAMSQVEFGQAIVAARNWIRMKKEALQVQFGERILPEKSGSLGQWSKNQWAVANPGQDSNEAAAEAEQAGYEVIP